MPALLLCLVRFLRLLLSGHQAIAIENAALRLQLAAFRRKRRRPVLKTFDRLFWVGLSRVSRGWSGPLQYVQADTVVRWQRERFRRFWAHLSRVDRRRCGRAATAVEIRRLIERMVAANPLWRAPRLHGELQMLGIPISERTVSRILRRFRRPPTQTWKTFLHNHFGQMVSMDYFTVSTITLRVLYVFLVLAHDRRRILHFAVTAHPTAEWTAQQLREAFPWDSAPRYLLRDRDRIFGHEFVEQMKAMGIKQVLSAPRSPWHSAYVERVIGTIRRECLR